MGERVEHSAAQCFLVLKISPHALAFLAMDDGRAGVLAKWQYSLGRRLGSA